MLNKLAYLIQIVGYLIILSATFRLALATKSALRLPHKALGIKDETPNYFLWLFGMKKISTDNNATLGIMWPTYDSALRRLTWGMVLQFAGTVIQFFQAFG